MWCESGLASSLTAFTNARLPSASTRRAASPGEKPPRCVFASMTCAPSRFSRSRRTFDGRSTQSTRTPCAGGLGEDTPPQLQVVVDPLLDRVPHPVRERHHEVLV